MSTLWIPKRRFAVIIGIEEYRPFKSTLPKVEYAKKDAEAFRALLLEQFGFQENEIVLWLDAHASKASFENELAYHIRNLGPDSLFYFYYAGHGFSQNGHNLLTCWDTFPGNLEGTSIVLRDVILDPLVKAGCQHSLVFLDSCAKDLAVGRAAISGLDSDELKAFTSAHPFHAQFMACSPGEVSYPSPVLQHGIWTWHLLRCLSGNIPEIISKERTITDHALRDYLAKAVPDYITHHTKFQGKQTPWANLGSSETIVIQTFPEVQAFKEQPIAAITIDYEAAFLRRVDIVSVKGFSGFDRKGGNTEPKYFNSTTRAFVQKVAADEIADEIKTIYRNTKDILGLKFDDISKSTAGNVTVEAFRFTLEVRQIEDEPHRARITRILQVRCKPNDLPQNIDKVFLQPFRTVVFPFTGEAEFAKLVRAFEHLEDAHGGKLEEDEDTGVIRYALPEGGFITVHIGDKEIVVGPSGAKGIQDLLAKTQEVLQTLQGRQKALSK